jgi:hypothetical protein
MGAILIGVGVLKRGEAERSYFVVYESLKLNASLGCGLENFWGGRGWVGSRHVPDAHLLGRIALHIQIRCALHNNDANIILRSVRTRPWCMLYC